MPKERPTLTQDEGRAMTTLRSPPRQRSPGHRPFSSSDMAGWKPAPYQRGFTLMELLWVLFILAILLAVVVPNFSGPLFQMGLENKARELFTAFTFTQQQAIDKNDTFGLFFNLTEGNQEITCYQRKGYDHGVPIVDPNNVLVNPLTHKPYLVKMSQEGLSNDARITEADFGGKHWVEFNPLGDPNCAGGRTILAGAGSSYTITVSRIGRLTFSGR